MGLDGELRAIETDRIQEFTTSIWGKLGIPDESTAMLERMARDYPGLDAMLLHLHKQMIEGGKLSANDIEKYMIGAEASALILSEYAQVQKLEE